MLGGGWDAARAGGSRRPRTSTLGDRSCPSAAPASRRTSANSEAPPPGARGARPAGPGAPPRPAPATPAGRAVSERPRAPGAGGSAGGPAPGAPPSPRLTSVMPPSVVPVTANRSGEPGSPNCRSIASGSPPSSPNTIRAPRAPLLAPPAWKRGPPSPVSLASVPAIRSSDLSPPGAGTRSGGSAPAGGPAAGPPRSAVPRGTARSTCHAGDPSTITSAAREVHRRCASAGMLDQNFSSSSMLLNSTSSSRRDSTGGREEGSRVFGRGAVRGSGQPRGDSWGRAIGAAGDICVRPAVPTAGEAESRRGRRGGGTRRPAGGPAGRAPRAPRRVCAWGGSPHPARRPGPTRAACSSR